MKKFKTLLCIAACLFGLTACGSTEPVDANTAQVLETIANCMIEGAYAPLSEEEADRLCSGGAEYVGEQFTDFLTYAMQSNTDIKADGQGVIDSFTSWQKAVNEIGPYIRTEGYETIHSGSDDTIIVKAHITCEKGTAQVEFIFEDDVYHTLKSSATNVDRTFGEKMKMAALNTLLGMGTVFIVLIIIFVIISMFDLIPKIQEAFSKKGGQKAAPALNAVQGPIDKAPEEEQGDDLELIAVITAAIAASAIIMYEMSL